MVNRICEVTAGYELEYIGFIQRDARIGPRGPERVLWHIVLGLGFDDISART